jgi:hypothetical protein
MFVGAKFGFGARSSPSLPQWLTFVKIVITRPAQISDKSRSNLQKLGATTRNRIPRVRNVMCFINKKTN